MQKRHFLGCALMIAVALAVVAASGGSTGSVGILLVALLCPISMGAVMWFLMGSTPRNERADAERVHSDR